MDMHPWVYRKNPGGRLDLIKAMISMVGGRGPELLTSAMSTHAITCNRRKIRGFGAIQVHHGSTNAI